LLTRTITHSCSCHRHEMTLAGPFNTHQPLPIGTREWWRGAALAGPGSAWAAPVHHLVVAESVLSTCVAVGPPSAMAAHLINTSPAPTQAHAAAAAVPTCGMQTCRESGHACKPSVRGGRVCKRSPAADCCCWQQCWLWHHNQLCSYPHHLVWVAAAAVCASSAALPCPSCCHC
jgi:hypothetical protein